MLNRVSLMKKFVIYIASNKISFFSTLVYRKSIFLCWIYCHGSYIFWIFSAHDFSEILYESILFFDKGFISSFKNYYYIHLVCFILWLIEMFGPSKFFSCFPATLTIQEYHRLTDKRAILGCRVSTMDLELTIFLGFTSRRCVVLFFLFYVII